MKKFLLKIPIYIIGILLLLELLVRVLHLYTEDPPRFIDESLVEKRVPGHQGYAVTGNRNQNFSKFNINEDGFNSHIEFQPSYESYEIAIIGDSFIEGFHQDYDKSIGVKIEALLDTVQVYQYGYAGYDLANQMHLINAYKEKFDRIDRIIIYLNYESDLGRGTYQPNYGRIKNLSSPIFKIRDNIKLLSYGSKIGILEPIKKLFAGSGFENNSDIDNTSGNLDEQYLSNFKNLIAEYGFDSDKTSILLDSRTTSTTFLDYCYKNGFDIIDFSESFEKSDQPVTLIYDHHWNNHGRDLIAKSVAEHFLKTK